MASLSVALRQPLSARAAAPRAIQRKRIGMTFPLEAIAAQQRANSSGERKFQQNLATHNSITQGLTAACLVAAHQSDELALHLNAVGTENARLIGLVGGLECNRIATLP